MKSWIEAWATSLMLLWLTRPARYGRLPGPLNPQFRREVDVAFANLVKNATQGEAWMAEKRHG